MRLCTAVGPLCAALLLVSAPVAAGQAPEPQASPAAPAPPTLTATRVRTPIVVDGELGDEGWRQAVPVVTWFETNPGDNLPAKVRSVGYLAYDERFFYAGFEFEDPSPRSIRAPLGERDNLSSATDYGGVILDTRNDGRTGIEFLANARGLQFDAVNSDTSGEDPAPDFYWDSAGRVTDRGWTLEIRIPFSSLRYDRADPQTWRVMLYRNYPRDFRYQFFSTRLPKGGNCFVCNSNRLEGLSGLPGGGHLVAAPYASASRVSRPVGGLGTRLDGEPLGGDVGLDVKWTPWAGTAVDATVNPDFSQIESDVAQIAANERFALFYGEKRPFFLEGIDLFSSPIQAVYTRTITSPRAGVRGTGKRGALAFTGLLADDRGGGQAIIPGPAGSSFADQDSRSLVAVGRVRRDFGMSYLSLIGTLRDLEGGGRNTVFGPDWQWRPSQADTWMGQLLFSSSRTPNRPDLASEWDGRSLSGHALDTYWVHQTRTWDLAGEYKDFSDDFRADAGFVPQVGYREGYVEAGGTVRPEKGFVRRLRGFLMLDYGEDREGEVLNQHISPGFGLDGRWNSFLRLRWAWDRQRAGDGTARTLPRNRLIYTITANPSRLVSAVSLDGDLGGQIDFEEARRGRGGNLTAGLTLRPTDHLELKLNEGLRWLDLAGGQHDGERLFTARVDRLRATYTITSRLFVRAVVQHLHTRRDPALYSSEVPRKDARLDGSFLLAYKLNWQTVLYAGYGDGRELSEAGAMERASRELFAKISYAWQR